MDNNAIIKININLFDLVSIQSDFIDQIYNIAEVIRIKKLNSSKQIYLTRHFLYL